MLIHSHDIGIYLSYAWRCESLEELVLWTEMTIRTRSWEKSIFLFHDHRSDPFQYADISVGSKAAQWKILQLHDKMVSHLRPLEDILSF